MTGCISVLAAMKPTQILISSDPEF